MGFTVKPFPEEAKLALEYVRKNSKKPDFNTLQPTKGHLDIMDIHVFDDRVYGFEGPESFPLMKKQWSLYCPLGLCSTATVPFPTDLSKFQDKYEIGESDKLNDSVESFASWWDSHNTREEALEAAEFIWNGMEEAS